MFGIDVSHHQGVIDWKEVVKNAPPIDFSFIKATEGTTYTDPKFKVNALGAAEAGIPLSYYHFATLNTNNVAQDAKQEAEYFLSVIKQSILPSPRLPLVLDIESNKAGLSKNDVAGWITSFFDTLKQHGENNFVLYSYTPFLDANLPSNHNFGNTRLWLAAYTNKPQPILPVGWKEQWLWQYSAKGAIRGITGNVDLNKSINPI